MRGPRFTIRWLMIAVAIVGTVLGVGFERRARFDRLARFHYSHFRTLVRQMANDLIKNNGDKFDSMKPSMKWHSEMHRKYADAAKRPWLFVEADPPEPK